MDGFESTVKVGVKHTQYEELRDLKQRGETFDDVIRRLLDAHKSLKSIGLLD